MSEEDVKHFNCSMIVKVKVTLLAKYGFSYIQFQRQNFSFSKTDLILLPHVRNIS